MRTPELSINPEGPFKVHMLNDSGKIKAQLIAGAFDTLLITIIGICRPDQRFSEPTLQDPAGEGWPPVNNDEMKQFIFDLQNASFRAKRAMAMLPENQQ